MSFGFQNTQKLILTRKPLNLRIRSTTLSENLLHKTENPASRTLADYVIKATGPSSKIGVRS